MLSYSIMQQYYPLVTSICTASSARERLAAGRETGADGVLARLQHPRVDLVFH